MKQLSSRYSIRKLALGATLILSCQFVSAQYTLQILHASDLEGGVSAIDRAPNFAAIMDALEEDYANTVILSAGDNYIPGPFFSAAGEQSVFRDAGVFNDTYNALFGTDAYNALREGNGRVDISIMNIIGFDASCMGNHEFDAGPDVIQTIIEEDFRSPSGPAGDRWVGAQFPYLSANLDFSEDGSLGGLFTSDILFNTAFATGPAESTAGDGGIPKIAPAVLIDVNGETIGVVGATTPLLASISSPGGVSVMGTGTNDMEELAGILQPTIDAIEALGVDKIILVSHLQQIALEEELAGLLTGVDVIIAGGSDTILANEGDDLLPEDEDNVGGAYPLETENADMETVFIVSTNGEYSYVGRLIVEFDEDGIVVSAGDDSGPYVSTQDKVEEVWGNLEDPFAMGTKGSEVQILVDAVTDIVIAKDGNVFGKSDVFVDGRRSQVRTQETNLGNLTADANLWFAKQIDETVRVSHKNGGGIRAAIGSVVDLGEGNFEFLPPQANPLSGKEDGEVSQLDIENSLRFNNGLTLLTLTAEGLLEVIEHSVAATAEGATPGQFGQWGGLSFSFDPGLEPGSRVVNAVLTDEEGNPVEVLARDGEVEGDPNRPIRIVSLNFLVGGGDAYPFPELGTDIVQLSAEGGVPQEVVDAGVADFANAGTEQDALAEYLAAFFSEDPFEEEETPAEEDARIQNLSVRSDNVIPGLTASFVDETTWVSELGESFTVAVEVTNLNPSPVAVGIYASPVSTAIQGLNYTITPAQLAPIGVSELMFEITPQADGFVGGTFIALKFSLGIPAGDEAIHTVLIADEDREAILAPIDPAITMSVLSSLETPEGAVAEIAAHDPESQRLFVTNSEDNQLLIFDFSDPTVSNIINTIEIDDFGGGINSVAVANGIVAVAVEAEEVGVRGSVVFLDVDGNLLAEVEAGFLPDMVTFTPDGTKVLTANEGEPDDDYVIDPVGSVSIIDISGGVDAAIVSEATFDAFDGMEDALRAQGIRIFGPGASASQDFEPEYIAVSEDGTTAYVTLQENNAVAVVDIETATVTSVLPLGFKDYSQVMNQIDASNESGGIFMAPWENLVGMYQPDAITAFVVGGQEYLITANEGDARDYDGFSEEERVKDLDLDPTAFPYADILQRDELLGRLNATTATGDTDGDGDIDVIHSYGARSFTIWNATDGSMVYDSKDELEAITAQDPLWGQFFNASNTNLSFMNRSDDKGPEPEGVITGVIGDRTYAFVILERIGGVVAYDVTDPSDPFFIQYVNNRDPEDDEAGDLAPEGILFVKAEDSPTGGNLLVISNEVSGTITVISLDEPVEPCFGFEVLAFDQGLQTNDNPVPVNRSDASRAIGQPDGSNAPGGFVSLGVGGSITIGFEGIAVDGPGDDIKIYETSFSGDNCGANDDEFAIIELSADGENFVSLGEVCRDAAVDIAEAGLEYAVAIRITNSDNTNTLDGYDVDGVAALYGCETLPIIVEGECAASQVVEYVQGTRSNGGAIATNRTNPMQALGEPEGTDALVFVTLGYNGSITLGFGGAVLNEAGADIEVVETTFNNNGCESYPEYADVYVSQNGMDFYFAKTVCKDDNLVEIDEAEQGWDYVNYVKLVNNNLWTTTPDGFDVDGVRAIHNCETDGGDDNGDEGFALVTEAVSVLSSQPNPTSGESTVFFTTTGTQNATLEVFDMNGRNVATLFNQVAEQGQEYRMDFDGGALSQGVYIYRLTTDTEVVIEKFMIAR